MSTLSFLLRDALKKSREATERYEAQKRDKADAMSDTELHDAGPWTASKDGRRINSEDFTHDVSLIVNGDFCDDTQRKAYADNLAASLNIAAGSKAAE